ncbi:MAG: dTDP-4-dehydrorhamnose 3,5-epimerase [Chloroflexota bacterium]|nr:dTDP-4-dehydrorhamnose 3,5-epimerase [Chloroflexota bacterium]
MAHGFNALSDLELVYLVTNEFDGSDEFGFRWDDPAAAVPWPTSQPILSERDASAPDLAAVLRELGQAEGASAGEPAEQSDRA